MVSFSSAKSCNCSGESCDSICAESASLNTAALGVGSPVEGTLYPSLRCFPPPSPRPGPEPEPEPPTETEGVAEEKAFLYKTLFSRSLTLSILFSTISRCTLAAVSKPVRRNHNTPSRTVLICLALSSAEICSGDFPNPPPPFPFTSSDSSERLAPPAQRQRAAPAALWPYFLRRRVDCVSWRRVSAEDRLEIEVARSRRHNAVEVSIASRSGSVRFVWGALVLVVGFVLGGRRPERPTER